MEVNAAVEESLKDVTYKVTFERPRDAGGKAAGKKITLTLDALAPVENVQQMVEMELFGKTGDEPAFLIREGRLLPPFAPLFHLGVVDGTTVTVAKEQPPLTEEERLMSTMFE